MKVESSLDLTTIVQMYQYCACSASAPSLLTTHLPADWHPLKYLWGVRSLLHQSQAEQLPSGPENRMDQLKSLLPQTGTVESALMTPQQWNVARCSTRVQGASSLWSFSDPPSGLPNLVVYITTKPSFPIYLIKTAVSSQTENCYALIWITCVHNYYT